MKKIFFLILFTCFCFDLFAQNVVGPDGDKLVWVLLIIIALIAFLFFLSTKRSKNTGFGKKSFFTFNRVKVELEKDRLYYPDILKLRVKNVGNNDIDLGRPLLIFDNFWLKRKFRIKGTGNYSFYPLYLEKGKTHTLDIDLNRFYNHDKRLKRFPKTKVIISNVNGKKLGSSSVFLRKTLFKF